MCHGQIVSTKLLTARRQGRPCGICERPIAPGREYVMHVVRAYDEGTLDNWKLCRACASWWSEHQIESLGYCPAAWKDSVETDLAERGGASFRSKLRRGWRRLTGGRALA